jgi:hypothetical protein
LEKTGDFSMLRTGGTYSYHSTFKCQVVKVKKKILVRAGTGA